MPTIRDIFTFLSSISEIHVEWLGTSDQLDNTIKSLKTDKDAQEGDLAWISLKQASSRPESIPTFKGSILIGPPYVSLNGIPYLRCDKPKLAYILVVNHFFSDLAEIVWPEIGQSFLPRTIIGYNVQLCNGVVLGSRVSIGDNVSIGPNTVIANTIIKSNVNIGANCSIGLPGFGYEADEDGIYLRFPHTGGVVIEQNVEIGSNTCIDRGSIGNTTIGSGVKIDNLVHIAHNVVVEHDSVIIANSMIGGSVTIAENAWIAPSVSIMNQARVGKSVILGLGTVVLNDVEEYAIMVGNPAKLLRKRQDV